jgi:hypothetical protein
MLIAQSALLFFLAGLAEIGRSDSCLLWCHTHLPTSPLRQSLCCLWRSVCGDVSGLELAGG